MKSITTLCLFVSAFCASGQITNVSVSAPGAASTLTSPTFYGMTNGSFRYYSPVIQTNDHSLPGYESTGLSCWDGWTMPIQVGFAINGKAFEVRAAAMSGGNCILFDGTSWTTTNQMPVNWTPSLVRVDFAQAGLHNIKFIFSGPEANFTGVNIASGDTLETNSFSTNHTLFVIGDSYTTSYNPDDAYCRYLMGFCMVMERNTNNVTVIPSGIGGSGYVWGGASGTNYINRITNDLFNIQANFGIKPDYVLFTGGLNDEANSVSSNSEFNAATALFQVSTSSLPSTKFAVAGNFYVGASPVANDTLIDGALKNASAAYGFSYWSPVAQTYRPALASDNVHPSTSGYADIANRLLLFMSTNNTGFPANPPPVTNYAQLMVGNIKVVGNVLFRNP